jgi:hypothetical protein
LKGECTDVGTVLMGGNSEMPRPKKLVVGASGFLGSHVTRQLVHNGEDVRVVLRTTSSTQGIDDIDVERCYGDIFDDAAQRGARRLLPDPGRGQEHRDDVVARPGANHGLLATGMRAVNAIPWMCEAPAGIVGALHLPLTSPLHGWAAHPSGAGVCAAGRRLIHTQVIRPCTPGTARNPITVHDIVLRAQRRP